MSIFSYSEMVERLVAAKVPRGKAEARAREVCGIPPITVERDASIDEKKEQHEIVKLFRGYRFKAYNLSQARAAKQTPGLGDLWCVHSELPIAFWWESKRQVDGELSPDQVEFRDDCIRCDVGYGTGDRYAAAEYLIALGVATLDNLPDSYRAHR